MRKSLAATFGSTLLALALTAGMAGAQSGTSTEAPKDSSAPSTQTDQSAPSSSQAPQPAQPQSTQQQQSAPPQAAPQNQSNSTTDGRSESRTTERIVETERTKVLGMDPMVALIVGAVLFVVIVLAIVSMSRKTSTTSVETTTRRSV